MDRGLWSFSRFVTFILLSISFIVIQENLKAFLPNGGRIEKIKIALIGIGNCSSSLIQGIYYYRDKDPQDMVGLMHHEIGGYKPEDIQVVAAFDIDERKVCLLYTSDAADE